MEEAEDNGNQNNGQNGYNGNQYNQNQYQNQQQQEAVQYFVGPYCKNSKYIHLGSFYDEDCSYPADTAQFRSQNYGASFPYMSDSEPIISPDECITCQETESYYAMKAAMKQFQYYGNQYSNGQQYNNGQAQNNYNGGQNNYNGQQNYNYAYNQDEDYGEASDLCGSSFEDAVKCDSDRGYTSGCYYLDTTLPTLDGRSAYFKNQDVADVYDKLKKNKNTAIGMGVVAAVALTALALMCGLCGSGGGNSNKKEALLEKEEDGQLA
jgi:hypothetical protein